MDGQAYKWLTTLDVGVCKECMVNPESPLWRPLTEEEAGEPCWYCVKNACNACSDPDCGCSCFCGECKKYD